MNEKRRKRISKYLSKHLRHRPERLSFNVEPGGWVDVDELLRALEENRFGLSRDELSEVVAGGDKPRFSFDASGRRVRANYVHLYGDRDAAREVGRRHGVPVLLTVSAAALAEAGGLTPACRHTRPTPPSSQVPFPARVGWPIAPSPLLLRKRVHGVDFHPQRSLAGHPGKLCESGDGRF